MALQAVFGIFIGQPGFLKRRVVGILRLYRFHGPGRRFLFGLRQQRQKLDMRLTRERVVEDAGVLPALLTAGDQPAFELVLVLGQILVTLLHAGHGIPDPLHEDAVDSPALLGLQFQFDAFVPIVHGVRAFILHACLAFVIVRLHHRYKDFSRRLQSKIVGRLKKQKRPDRSIKESVRSFGTVTSNIGRLQPRLRFYVRSMRDIRLFVKDYFENSFPCLCPPSKPFCARLYG